MGAVTAVPLAAILLGLLAAAAAAATARRALADEGVRPGDLATILRLALGRPGVARPAAEQMRASAPAGATALPRFVIIGASAAGGNDDRPSRPWKHPQTGLRIVQRLETPSSLSIRVTLDSHDSPEEMMIADLFIATPGSADRYLVMTSAGDSPAPTGVVQVYDVHDWVDTSLVGLRRPRDLRGSDAELITRSVAASFAPTRDAWRRWRASLPAGDPVAAAIDRGLP